MATPKRESGLYILYNFMEQLPPHGNNEGEGLADGYWRVVQAMQEHHQFLEGMLLKDIDCRTKGSPGAARYPYLHYVLFNTAKQGRFIEDTQWAKVVREGYGDKQTRHIAAYNEMFTFIDPTMPFLPKRSSNPNVAYIVSSFKTVGNLDSLDKNWSCWSGADYIVANAPPKLKLQRLTLHKSLTQGTYTYVLMCELSEALSDLCRTRDFVERIRSRECGITSLYTIDHFF